MQSFSRMVAQALTQHSANEVSETFSRFFLNFLLKRVTPEQIHNVEEAGFFWCCLLKTTLAASNEMFAP